MIDDTIVDDLRNAGVADDLVRRVDELRSLAVLQRRELEGRNRRNYDTMTAGVERMRRERTKPQQARALRYLKTLYPSGVPGPDVLTDGQIVKAVSDAAQDDGNAPKLDSILRAAGRRQD